MSGREHLLDEAGRRHHRLAANPVIGKIGQAGEINGGCPDRAGAVSSPAQQRMIERLRPKGMWALNGRASVVVYATTRTIVLSENLISRRRGRVGVWKLEDGRATWVPISLGYTALNSIQVVSGLAPGDVVLVPRHRYEWEPINVHQQQTATREPTPQ